VHARRLKWRAFRLAIWLSILYAVASLFAQDSPQESGNPSTAQTAAEPLQLSMKEMKKLFVKRVRPEYPALAEQARIIGKCRVRIVIGADGSLHGVKLVFGHPILAPAAIDAVRKSKYRPYLAHGRPVEVEGEVEYNIP